MAIEGEHEMVITGTRDTARQQMPRALREEVRLVGEVLGQVIAEHGGDSLLADVEMLRTTVIHSRRQGDVRTGYAKQADATVFSWSLDRAEEVARAFTCYFHLVNLAEERFRARTLREAEQGSEGPAEAVGAALETVRDEFGDAGVASLLAALRIHPVFTAHPTEARRRAVTSSVRRVGEQLDRLGNLGSPAAEQPEIRRRLWALSENRRQQYLLRRRPADMAVQRYL